MFKALQRPKNRISFFRHAAAIGAACAVWLASAGPSAAAAPPAALLAQYEPLMRFDPLETFAPTRVESFIVDSDLEQLTSPATWTLVNSHPGPGNLPGADSGVWRLNQRACTPSEALGGLGCYAAAWNEGSGGAVVYGRVVQQDDRIVLQYWYFYYDDVYSYTYPPSDFIWQAHEGDWETVNVVLSDETQPLYVGYSEHCLGQRRSWEDTPRFDETHPVVHVAIGSHANSSRQESIRSTPAAYQLRRSRFCSRTSCRLPSTTPSTAPQQVPLRAPAPLFRSSRSMTRVPRGSTSPASGVSSSTSTHPPQSEPSRSGRRRSVQRFTPSGMIRSV